MSPCAFNSWRLGVLLMAVSCGVVAAEAVRAPNPVYAVELIVFRNVSPLGVAEDWNAESGAPTVTPASAAGADDAEGPSTEPPGTERVAVNSLPAAQFRLAALESSLGRSKGYEVLAHVGWTQIATPRGAGLASDLASLGIDSPALHGTVALERGKYLYLRMNLAYAPDSPPSSLVASGDTSGRVTFTLNQVRRIKPFERHYFDHPAFGVIAMVSTIGN